MFIVSTDMFRLFWIPMVVASGKSNVKGADAEDSVRKNCVKNLCREHLHSLPHWCAVSDRHEIIHKWWTCRITCFCFCLSIDCLTRTNLIETFRFDNSFRRTSNVHCERFLPILPVQFTFVQIQWQDWHIGNFGLMTAGLQQQHFPIADFS